MNEDEYYTVTEVSNLLKVRPRVIHTLLRAGALKGIKVGKVWRITKDSLEIYRGRKPTSIEGVKE